MRLYAFLVAAAFWPGAIDPATTLRWAVMAVGATLLAFMSDDDGAPLPWRAGWAFMALAGITLLWTPDLIYGLEEGIHLTILACVFLLGTQQDDLTPAWEGLAAGVAVSGAIALWQVSGVSPVEQVQAPAGLFMNKNMLAEAGMVALIPMLLAGRPWLALGPLLAALVPASRAVLLALAVVALLLWRRRKPVEAVLLMAAALATVGTVMWLDAAHPGQGAWYASTEHMLDGSSSLHRLDYWRETLANLTPLGHGLGSFMANFPAVGHAHSEPIQAAYEIGIIALIPATLLVYLFREPGHHVESLVLAAILVTACFAFPLHMPVTGFAAALAAGHLARLRYRGRGLKPALGVAGAGAAHGEAHAHG